MILNHFTSALKKPILLPQLDPLWKQRLITLLDDVLDFSEYPVRGGEGTRAESRDSRTILETFERNGVLERGSLQLALPIQDSLELLKLSCWTLIWLKCLFPGWEGVEAWVQNAADRASDTGVPVEKQLYGYRVLCRYNSTANVLEYQVSRANAAPF